MIEHLTKVKNILIIPKAYLRDKKTQYLGSKGHSAISDEVIYLACHRPVVEV